MARKFMAGVATAYLFDGDRLFATAKTLTESSLTIGNSAEEIRGGASAGLLGKYFHTSTFDLTLTDALFDLNYIAASVGADVEYNQDIMMEEQLTAASGKVTLTKTALGFGCEVTPYAYYKLPTEETWKTKKVEEDNTFTDAALDNNDVCVKYFYKEISARGFRVKQNYIPDTFRVVLKETLYAAGANATGQTKIGHVEIIIPRFQLDGSQDLSMSMTGAATTSIKGSALATEDCEAGCDDGAGYYATIIEVLDDTTITSEDILELIADGYAGTATDPVICAGADNCDNVKFMVKLGGGIARPETVTVTGVAADPAQKDFTVVVNGVTATFKLYAKLGA